MRIAITLVIELSDQQIAVYAEEHCIPQQPAGHYRARDIAADVRTSVLVTVQNSPAFHESGADVSIKR